MKRHLIPHIIGPKKRPQPRGTKGALGPFL
jgi:hypothetical protein